MTARGLVDLYFTLEYNAWPVTWEKPSAWLDSADRSACRESIELVWKL